MGNLAVAQQPEQAFQYLKFVAFKDLLLWDVKRLFIEKIISDYPIATLGKYVQEEITKIKPKEYPEDEHRILGVNNQVGVFDAYTQLGKEIKQAYKKMNTGFLAYNPYRVNVGSIGLKTNEHTHNLISPAYVVFSCKKKLMPEYLFRLFKTERFNQVIRENTTGSVRQNLTYQILQSLQIPLPGLPEQEIILARCKQKIDEAEQLEQELKTFNDRYQSILFEHLGIKIIQTQQVKNKLQFVNFKDVSRWGYQFLLNCKKSDNLLRTDRYPLRKLIELIMPNPRTDFSKLQDEDISFLPMVCISDTYGEIAYYKDGKISNSKGYTRFKDGDLLWSKITPCMQNGKSCVVSGLKNGFGYGSTEYHVLRNKDIKELNIKFLYHILRTKHVLNHAMFHFKGSAGQQRVPIEFLTTLKIPLPSLPIQKQIVQELDKLVFERKAKQARSEQLRKEAQQEFEQTVFSSSDSN